MKTREGILLGEIYKKDNTETFVIYKILFKVLKSREKDVTQILNFLEFQAPFHFKTHPYDI